MLLGFCLLKQRRTVPLCLRLLCLLCKLSACPPSHRVVIGRGQDPGKLMIFMWPQNREKGVLSISGHHHTHQDRLTITSFQCGFVPLGDNFCQISPSHGLRGHLTSAIPRIRFRTITLFHSSQNPPPMSSLKEINSTETQCSFSSGAMIRTPSGGCVAFQIATRSLF